MSRVFFLKERQTGSAMLLLLLLMVAKEEVVHDAEVMQAAQLAGTQVIQREKPY